MQSSFEEIGFKLRMPVFNRADGKLGIRTAIVPINIGNKYKIEFATIQLSDRNNFMMTAFKDDITPAEIELEDVRQVITAVFPNSVEETEGEYDLCISLINHTSEKRIQVHYKFLAGSAIAELKQIDVLDIDMNVNGEDIQPSNIAKSEEEQNGKKAESASSEITEEAFRKAIHMVELANTQLEDAACKLVEKDRLIAELRDKIENPESASKEEFDKVLQAHQQNVKRVEELENKVASIEKEKEEELESLRSQSARYYRINTRLQDQLRQMDKSLLDEREHVHFLRQELEKEKSKKKLPDVSDMEKHLNEIIDYMDHTAKISGISLQNLYVRTYITDGIRHVDLYGEIVFADGVKKLDSGCTIKAAIYDADGKIVIENNTFIARDKFKGFDTFKLGWENGTDERWASRSKIRVFVV